MAKMFSIIMNNFFKKPATRLYPAEKRQPFERARGRIYFENENCIYCGICQRKCPADAIVVDRNNSLWELNAFRCIVCGECVTSCPKKCITISNERRSAARSKKTISIKKQIEETK